MCVCSACQTRERGGGRERERERESIHMRDISHLKVQGNAIVPQRLLSVHQVMCVFLSACQTREREREGVREKEKENARKRERKREIGRDCSYV